MDNFSAALTLLLFSIAFLLTLFTSGNALLILIGPYRKNWSVDLRVPLAMVLGLSLIPVCLLWTSTLGLQLSPTFAFFYLGVAVLVNLLALAFNLLRSSDHLFSLKRLWQDPSYKSLAWLGGILFLTWITRFLAVRGFLVAPGADSYHHTLIATLIAQEGRIPASYEPYAPPSSFTYHFGFHAIAAFMYWLTGIPLTKLVLWVGQGINALAVLSMYFLTKRLTNHNSTALVASFLVGLVTVFPAYMTNWSRFTQLSGLVILIVAVGLVVPDNRGYWRIIPLLVSGIFLSHYRVFAMFGLLIVALLLVTGIDVASHRRLIEFRQPLSSISAAFLGLIIVIPWLIKLLSVSQLFELANYIQDTTTQYNTLRSFYDLQRLDTARVFYSNYWILVLAFVGLLRGIIKHRKITLVLVLWTGLLLLWSNPYWLAVPGAGLLDLNSVVMSLFGPLGFFAALGVIQLSSEVAKNPFTSQNRKWGWKLALVGFTSFAIIRMATIVNPDNVFVRATDMQAMNWIRTHTESDSKFLINPIIFGWSTGSITGNDAGYWIPLLTDRQTTILPVVMGNERIPRHVLETEAVLSQIAINPDASSLATLKREGVTHIFIGERGGPIPLRVLENTPCASEVWGKGKTRIFKLNYKCLE
jgi:hypothetical protein